MSSKKIIACAAFVMLFIVQMNQYEVIYCLTHGHPVELWTVLELVGIGLFLICALTAKPVFASVGAVVFLISKAYGLIDPMKAFSWVIGTVQGIDFSNDAFVLYSHGAITAILIVLIGVFALFAGVFPRGGKVFGIFISLSCLLRLCVTFFASSKSAYVAAPSYTLCITVILEVIAYLLMCFILADSVKSVYRGRHNGNRMSSNTQDFESQRYAYTSVGADADLQRIKMLLENGKISDEEYAILKERIIGK